MTRPKVTATFTPAEQSKKLPSKVVRMLIWEEGAKGAKDKVKVRWHVRSVNRVIRRLVRILEEEAS